MCNHTRIFLGLAVLLALSLRPGAPLAIEHSSARISSLGGDHVAGVIPDLYTDIGVNPAYADFAERLIVGHSRRYVPDYAPSLPYLEESSSSHYGSSMLVNDLSAWGIRLSSWRTAIFAQWALQRPESSSSDLTIYTDSYGSRLNEFQSSGDDDFASIDLIAARAICARYTLGLRLHAWGYYNSSSDLRTNDSDRYADQLFSQLEYDQNSTSARSFLGRRLSFDFQAGIAKSNDTGPQTDLALTASLNRLDYRKQRYDLSIYKYYDSMGEIDTYSYYRYYWNDAREGDLWNIALTFRHTFDCGIRVLAGGGVSTCSYETEWRTSEDIVNWGWTSTRDELLSGAFDGEGSLFGADCFVKGGRLFSLHETTDLYIGLHGVFARTRTEEEPLIHYASESDGEASAVLIDQTTRFESIENSFDLWVPLSIEFRPSSYFTYFSSFILYGRWNRQVTTKPALSLFSYFPPVAAALPDGASHAGTSSFIVIEPETYTTNWTRALDTGSTVTLGFSLHYRDRFFVDVYTAIEIIPHSLEARMIDVRYAF